jgi:hypothetical protein
MVTVGKAGSVPLFRAHQWVDFQYGYFEAIFQFDHVNFWEKFTVGKVGVANLSKQPAGFRFPSTFNLTKLGFVTSLALDWPEQLNSILGPLIFIHYERNLS